MGRVVPVLAAAIALAACNGSTSVETSITAESTTTPTSTSTTTTPPTPTTAVAPPPTSGPQITVITVIAGQVEGPGSIPVTQGERVRFAVLADVTDEVHVHGYDLFFDVVAGVSTVVEFIADVPGIFEVELESSHLELVQITVMP